MKNFKDSGIEWLGEIPQHWEVSKFKYFYRSNMGETILAQDLKDEGVPIYSATEDDKFFGRIKNPINLLNINDFVIPARGNSIGAVKIVKEKSTCTQTTIFSKQFKEMNPYYVYYFLSGYRKFLFEFTQTAIPQITISQVNDNPILYPPLKEQEQIANFLDEKCEQIVNFIEKKEKLISLLKEQKQVLINETITKGLDKNVNFKDSGIEWLGEIPQHWEIVKLKYLGNFQNGISINSEAFGVGYPFVSYGDVYNNISIPFDVKGLVNSTEIDRKVYSVKQGDIFFTRTSETIDEIGISSVCLKTIENAVFAGFLIRFRANKKILDNNFAKFYFRRNLNQYFFAKENGLVTRASLGQELLGKLPVIIPPLKEQKQIANFLDEKCEKIDLLIEKTKKQIKLIKEYKTTLINQAVCGRIDL
ncbi:TPA: restriction endonuclease subunit S [Campylobacter coli]|nr:restriction endonuclease subunit S [Campylobacter coli]HEB9318866.1 restriction endonuclease subunit S [Campylobacter coli]